MTGSSGKCPRTVQCAAVFSEDHDSACSRQHASPRIDRTKLRQFPGWLSRADVNRAQHSLCGFVRCLPERSAHEALAGLPLDGNFGKDSALVIGLDIVQAGHGIEW